MEARATARFRANSLKSNQSGCTVRIVHPARRSDWGDIASPTMGGIVRFKKCLGAVALLFVLAVSPARADIIVLGHLDFDLDTLLWEVDQYTISITDPTAFFAKTIGGPSNVADPVMFLFGADNRGVYMNDDTSIADLQSTLPAGHPLGPIAPGIYHLAIGWAFTDPQSASGSIFPVYESSLDTTGVYGPTGSGGADPLTGFLPGGPPDFDLPADYAIRLAGAVNITPEPGTLALFALGFLIVAARVRLGRAL